MRKFVLVPLAALVAISLAACSTAAGVTGGEPGSQPTSQPTSNVVNPTPAPTTEPTPAPTKAPTPVPEATPAADKVAEYLIPYGDDDHYAHADVIAEIKNIGGTWIKLSAYESDYTIYDQAGDVITTGSFTYPFPAYLAPGETGYLAEDVMMEDVKKADMARVEVNAYFDEAEESDAIVLVVESSKNKPGDDYDGTTTTGKIKNTSSEDVDGFHVGAIYLDSNNKPLGFSYTNLGQNLGAGQSKAYETLSAGPDVSLKNVANTVIKGASSYDY